MPKINNKSSNEIVEEFLEFRAQIYKNLFEIKLTKENKLPKEIENELKEIEMRSIQELKVIENETELKIQ